MVETTIDPYLQKQAEAAIRDGLGRLRRGYSRLRRAKLSAALVTLDSRTGAVLAHVGSDPSARGDSFDRVRQARRQPGSTVKPFVLLEALDECGSHRSLPISQRVSNEPLTIELDSGTWSPRNPDGRFSTTVDLRDVSGISGVEWDAVELPSQFMENWCYHRPTLLGMAVHYETGEVLPDDLYEKICKARTYRAASQMLRQLQFGMTDIELHSKFDSNGSETPFDVHLRIAKQTSAMMPLPEGRFLCAFSHIFAGGYAAGYYSYKWAEVLSADAFAAFEEAGLDDEKAVAETGRRFRDTVLSEGGSRHPMEIYEQFRGRKPTVDALLRHSGLTSAKA